MTNRRAHVYFDFVDPGSYLLHLQMKQLRTAAYAPRQAPHAPSDAAEESMWVGMELALPPNEMIDPAAPEWRAYCDDVDEMAQESGCRIPRPEFVPWSRKAHELLLHARESGAEHAVREALFRAHFEDARDVGRVDVLTEIAREQGLDHSETRAVLDVDKYTEALATQRTDALAVGIVRIPTVRIGARSLVGPAGIHDLRTLFESPGGPTTGT